MRVESAVSTIPSRFADTMAPESRAGDPLHPCANDRRLRPQERNRLALHVRSHERAVRIVILQKGISAAETETICLGETSIYWTSSAVTSLNSPATRAETLGTEILPRPSTGVFACAITKFSAVHCGKILDHLGHFAALHFTVRRLNEPEIVHTRIRSQRNDKADIRTFRGLYGADPSIMGRMHITDSKPARSRVESAGAECRQPALMCDLRQRIGLVHELGKLA